MSDTGGGHRASVKALMATVDEMHPTGGPKQTMVDVFAECSGFLNIFAQMYGPLVNRYPSAWGKLFYFFEDEKQMERLEKLARPFIKKGLVRLYERQNPDLIVSVHPLVNHLTVKALQEMGRTIPFATVVTDPVDVHRTWVAPEVDLLIVATDEARVRALKYGIAPEKLKVIGLPVHPKFLKPADSASEIRKRLGLKPNLQTVLLMGGGEGGGHMDRIVRELEKTQLPMQTIVVAGRNQKLQMTLERMVGELKMPLKVYGFTDEVPDLMSASDIFVGKGGPGTMAESLAKEIPLVITSWLPGQEEGNVEYVRDHNLGRLCKDYSKIGETIKALLEPKTLAVIRENIRRVRRPRASHEIMEELFWLIKA